MYGRPFSMDMLLLLSSNLLEKNPTAEMTRNK